MKTSFTASAAAAGEDKNSPTSHADSREDRGAATPSPAPLAAWPLRAGEVSATLLTTASLPPSIMHRESSWAAEAAEDAAVGAGEAGEAPAFRKNGTEKSRKRSASLITPCCEDSDKSKKTTFYPFRALCRLEFFLNMWRNCIVCK
jgi:hypothetical protein